MKPVLKVDNNLYLFKHLACPLRKIVKKINHYELDRPFHCWII